MNAHYLAALMLFPFYCFSMEPPAEYLTEDEHTKPHSFPIIEIHTLGLLDSITGQNDPNQAHSLGLTALHYLALYDNDGFAIDCLCKRDGINSNVQDKLGSTPLHKAAAQGNFIAAQILLKHNADINAKNNSDKTPLHCALYCNDEKKSFKLIVLLLVHGADVDSTDKFGWSAYHLACWKQKEDIQKLLIEYGADQKRLTNDNKIGKVLQQEGHLLKHFPKLYRNYVLNKLAPARPASN